MISESIKELEFKWYQILQEVNQVLTVSRRIIFSVVNITLFFDFFKFWNYILRVPSDH